MDERAKAAGGVEAGELRPDRRAAVGQRHGDEVAGGRGEGSKRRGGRRGRFLQHHRQAGGEAGTRHRRDVAGIAHHHDGIGPGGDQVREAVGGRCCVSRGESGGDRRVGVPHALHFGAGMAGGVDVHRRVPMPHAGDGEADGHFRSTFQNTNSLAFTTPTRLVRHALGARNWPARR